MFKILIAALIIPDTGRSPKQQNKNQDPKLPSSGRFSRRSFRQLQPGNFPLAKLLYSGTPIKSYIVYTDNGDIEKSEE